MESTEVQRCGRCQTILTDEELSNQRHEDRPRCGGCENPGTTKDFLRLTAIHAPSDKEAADEWVRRIHLARC